MVCHCCRSFVADVLRGISLLTALGGLACVLLGVHALLPLGATALNVNVAWFSWCLVFFGCILLLTGVAASTGPWCNAWAPLHCFTGSTLALLPVEALIVWAYCQHPIELRRIAAYDQTYTAMAIIKWVDGHPQLAAGLAGLWMLFQALVVVLGALLMCCPAAGRRRRKHPWDQYWEADAREALLPRMRPEVVALAPGSPQAAGYHTPSSHFASPYSSPQRPAKPAAVPSAPAMPTYSYTVQ